MWRILIVDDNHENCELLVEILRDMAVCEAVSTGKAAIQTYEKSLQGNSYDLILLDIMMPDISGLEILTQIRQTEKSIGIPLGEGVPIIMVTAHKKPFLDAFYQGCTDYIIKPIDPEKLRKKITEKLNKSNPY